MTNPIKIPGWPEAFTPQMPGFGGQADSTAAANPFMGSLDFMKNLWGSLPSGAPGFVVPTFDLEDLDKRIKDLKAVQSWLNVNASMLNATIQGLEVQRNTIAALQAIGGTMGSNAAEFFKPAAASSGAAAETPKAKPVEPDWSSIAPGWPNTVANANAEPELDKKAAAPASSASPADPAEASRKSSGTGSAEGDARLQPMPATAWLGFMQDQFAKLASAAVAPVVAPASPGAAVKPDVGAKGAARTSPLAGRKAAMKTGGSSMATSTAPKGSGAAVNDAKSQVPTAGRKAAPKGNKPGQ